MRKGFTLIELMVAVGLLAVVLSFAGVIFNVSIESHRMASANAEISQKLRAITDQLNTDFGGTHADAPLLIWFEKGPDDDPNRYDQIMFFADGDFQSIQLYEDVTNNAVPDPKGDKVVSGNAARIHYGQAQLYSSGSIEPKDMDEKDRLFARRQHILTADPCLLEWPDATNIAGSFTGPLGTFRNECYEHDSLSLSFWKTVQASDFDNAIIDTCFVYRPIIDLDDPNTFHKLMCEGVGSFAIQWAYWDNDELSWYPVDSDFTVNQFGVYFNVPGSINSWVDGLAGGNDYNIFPKALKFTFRLYDSRGLIKEDGRTGREFTHIVYLGD